MTASIRGRTGLIASVLRIGDRSQVLYAVVGLVLVDVIDLIVRPLSPIDQPYDPVNEEGPLADGQTLVTIRSYPTSGISSVLCIPRSGDTPIAKIGQRPRTPMEISSFWIVTKPPIGLIE